MRGICFVLICLLLAALPLTVQAAPPSSQGRLVFHQQVVMDAQGFNMEAFRLLVPEGWSFKGGVTWNTRKIPPEAVNAYAVTGPDKVSVLEQFAPRSYFWSQDQSLQYAYAQQGVAVTAPMGAVEYIKSVFLPQTRAGAQNLRVAETTPLPELARQAKTVTDQQMQLFHSISPFTFPMEIRTDAGRAKVTYRQAGKDMVEDVTVTLVSMIAYAQSMYGTIPSVNWVASVRSFRTPADRIGQTLPLFRTMTDSYRENPEWQVRNTRLVATITRDQIRHQNAVFQKFQEIRRSQAEVSDMIVDSYRKRDQAYDRIFDNYSQAVRGVEAWQDPVNDRRVEIPTGYDNAWTDGSTYVFSEDPSYNPNIGDNRNWEPMRRER